MGLFKDFFNYVFMCVFVWEVGRGRHVLIMPEEARKDVGLRAGVTEPPDMLLGTEPLQKQSVSLAH